MATFAAIIAASWFAAYALAELSSDQMEDLLDRTLSDHLGAEAGLLAGALSPEPLEALAVVGAGAGSDALARRVGTLVEAASLHDAVLFDPSGRPLARPSARPWIAERADADLVRDAREAATVGDLYETAEGALYLTAYAPVPGHPGFVVGVEGSGATLGAVADLETVQLYAGAAVVVVGAMLGLVLATALSRPLSRLAHEVARTGPGSPPDAIAIQGPREVRRVAASVRDLLAAIQDRDEALRASHAARLAEVTTLAATVAHEVRNPANALGIILGGVRTAQTGERREQLVARAEGCVAEIESIVERFLDLSRPVVAHLAPCDLSEVCGRSAAEGPAELTVEVQGPGARLVTDGELVGQVLRNLVRNAAEAGATRVTLTVDEDGIRVTDDGPGIREEDVERVFEWFHTGRARGVGLGLPLSRRICRALGGELELISCRPTTFHLQLGGGER
ncbi:MAG: HAMP domain-containing histidine kinase [Myxococcales bacterium]|nr:HAMP domain-containing histidine kinase [Myxococcales bacterium]